MKRLLFLCLLVSFFPGHVSAQFEGEIAYRAYEPDNLFQARYMDLYISPERILMQSADSYNVLQGLQANAVLIRNDQQDFVFKSSSTEGVRITRDDIEGLSDLLSRFSGSAGNSSTRSWGRVEETGRTRRILGYETHEFTVREQDRDAYTTVWLTDGIKVNWGVVREVWHETTSSLVESDLPIEMFINRNSFPLRVELYEADELQTIFEATNVTVNPVNDSLFEIPREMRLVGFGELMMRIMRARTFGQ